MEGKNETWCIAELMGHLTLAGRVTKPGEYGGLWQVDIPEGESFRTEFFGSQAVYRIRIVSEEIARAYSVRNEVIEYNAPIVTREEHQRIVERLREENYKLMDEYMELRTKLDTFKALPEGEVVRAAATDPDEEAGVRLVHFEGYWYEVAEGDVTNVENWKLVPAPNWIKDKGMDEAEEEAYLRKYYPESYPDWDEAEQGDLDVDKRMENEGNDWYVEDDGPESRKGKRQ